MPMPLSIEFTLVSDIHQWKHQKSWMPVSNVKPMESGIGIHQLVGAFINVAVNMGLGIYRMQWSWLKYVASRTNVATVCIACDWTPSTVTAGSDIDRFVVTSITRGSLPLQHYILRTRLARIISKPWLWSRKMGDLIPQLWFWLDWDLKCAEK